MGFGNNNPGGPPPDPWGSNPPPVTGSGGNNSLGGSGGGGLRPPHGPGGPGGPRPPRPPTNPNNPAQITRTGILYGTFGLMLTPYLNPLTKKSYVVIHDPTDFDCEENAEYDFRQEIPVVNQMPQEGRDVSIHLIILKYREIDIATFSINITVYRKKTDDFATKLIPVNIVNPNKSGRIFPDNRIHTRYIGLKPVISGERPQCTLTRNANSGGFSITSVTLCGNGDETPQI